MFLSAEFHRHQWESLFRVCVLFSRGLLEYGERSDTPLGNRRDCHDSRQQLELAHIDFISQPWWPRAKYYPPVFVPDEAETEFYRWLWAEEEKNLELHKVAIILDLVLNLGLARRQPEKPTTSNAKWRILLKIFRANHSGLLVFPVGLKGRKSEFVSVW